MSHTSTTISAPVSTSDVAAVLAVASNNVGYLCSNLHGKINKWSAHKPVISPNLTKSTEDTFKNAWYGYGMDVIFVDDIDDVPGVYTDTFKKKGWNYELPASSSGAQGTIIYRLGDFDGYNHAALPPFSLFECSASVKKGSRFEAQLYENGGTGRVNFFELMEFDNMPLSTYYFGICFVDTTSGNIVGAVTNTTPGEPYFIDYLPVGVVAGRTYKVYPFYSRYQITPDMEAWQIPHPMGDRASYCPIPCVSETTMAVTA